MIRNIKYAFLHVVPVITGYLFLGASFGLLMSAEGHPLWLTLSMSLFVYAGSMQFAGIPLLSANFDPLSVFLLAIMVNARHLFYGITMLIPYQGLDWKRPYTIFAMTDETFSVQLSLAPPQDLDRSWLYFLTALFDQIFWVIGSLIGVFAGQVFSYNTKGLDFVLTALFVTIFTDQWLDHPDHRPALIGLGSGLVSLILFGADRFLIPAMLLIISIFFVNYFLKEGQHD